MTNDEAIDALVSIVRNLESITRSRHLTHINFGFKPYIGSQVPFDQMLEFVERSAADIASKLR